MRYLTLSEVLDLHRSVIEQSGGADGVRELGGVESAVAQPQMTFGGDQLYRTVESKATALCFTPICRGCSDVARNVMCPRSPRS